MEIIKYSLSIKTPVAKKKRKKKRERQKCPKFSNNPSLFMFSHEESHLKWSWAISNSAYENHKRQQERPSKFFFGYRLLFYLLSNLTLNYAPFFLKAPNSRDDSVLSLHKTDNLTKNQYLNCIFTSWLSQKHVIYFHLFCWIGKKNAKDKTGRQHKIF